MQTIRLRVNDKIIKNLMWFLGKFSKTEIQIINEDTEFLAVQHYLQQELKRVENGEVKFISLDELDSNLESTIQNYET